MPTLTNPGDKEIWETDDVTFVTHVTGKPKPDVEWFHGFSKLKPSDKVEIESDGDTYRLILRECVLDDTGTVTVVASSKAGKLSAECSLLVKGKWLKHNKSIIITRISGIPKSCQESSGWLYMFKRGEFVCRNY